MFAEREISLCRFKSINFNYFFIFAVWFDGSSISSCSYYVRSRPFKRFWM